MQYQVLEVQNGIFDGTGEFRERWKAINVASQGKRQQRIRNLRCGQVCREANQGRLIRFAPSCLTQLAIDRVDALPKLYVGRNISFDDPSDERQMLQECQVVHRSA
jgi:hypothetical protein